MKINPSLSLLATLFFSCTSFAANLIDLSQQEFRPSKSADYQWVELNKSTDIAGNTHIRYQQTYQGIPVYGYQIMEHQYAPSLAGASMSLKPRTGTLVQDLERDLPAQLRAAAKDPAATLLKLKAQYAAQQGFSLEALEFENETARTVIYLDQNNTARLAHEVNFFVDTVEGGEPSRPHYLIDAQTLAVIKEWEGLTTKHIGTGPGGNQRIGYYQFGKDFPALDITQNRGRCTMSGSGGKTVHMMNRTRESSTAYSYTCRRGTTQDQDATNGAASPINDAHFFIDVLTNFYAFNYNSSPLPFSLVMRTHYGKNYANAFWNGSSMTYGDGDKNLYPFVVLDIASHEIAHGLTETTSNLIYDGESGGMNEAFSDIASRAVDNYVYGTNDWYLGGDIFKDKNILALRYMDYPPADGYSIDHTSDYYYGLDVHYSSGIYNKAFYLLATTPGWGTHKAFDAFYIANVAYWQANSTFAQGAVGVMQATAALGRNVDDVVNAFSQVGIQCDKVAQTCI